jgi:hypothetical protein
MSKTVLLHLRFDKPISRQYWPVVVRALRNVYPGICWNGGGNLDTYRSAVTLFITPKSDVDPRNPREVKDYIGVAYSSTHIGKLNVPGWGEIPAPVDGEEWVAKHDTDFDQTSDLFDSLNESSIRKIILRELGKLG